MAAPVGNKNAKKAKVWSDAIHKHLAQNPKDLIAIAKSLINKAKDGDIAAIREIGDRLEGKPVQGIVGEINHSLIVEITRFADKTTE